MKASREQIMSDVLSLLGKLADDWEYTGEITPTTRFFADMGLGSLDVVVLGTAVQEHYKQVLPFVRYIHSVASDSVLRELGRHGTPETEVLVEVNVAAEEGKSGIAPAELDDFIARCPVEVVGLMTMPPLAEEPEQSRPWFAALAELAAERGLRELSMGTSQDYSVAVQEGATIIRLGTVLYR